MQTLEPSDAIGSQERTRSVMQVASEERTAIVRDGSTCRQYEAEERVAHGSGVAERALLGRSLSKAPLRIDKEATTVRHGQGLWTWAWTHG
jgi:hypothetical protein